MNRLTDLEPNLRRRLIDSLENGSLAAPYPKALVRSAIQSGEEAEQISDALQKLAALGIHNEAAAAWIRTVGEQQEATLIPDLVWTGPEFLGLRSRDTDQVFREMLQTAESSLWATTYAYFRGQQAFHELASRMDEVPELDVNLLLNVIPDRNSSDDPEELVRRFADKFWSQDWPGSKKPRVFYFPAALDQDPSQRAVFHAKTIIQDEKIVYITSANFTEAARERNIEVGIRLDSSSLAHNLIRHYQRLIEGGFLELLPH
jgi:phosphatidylserine/phosphatidylglycerophosphate/cardiolipin synthase-like enzyme